MTRFFALAALTIAATTAALWYGAPARHPRSIHKHKHHRYE